MAKDSFYKSLPQTPGVYLMKDKKGQLLYVGKAANLRRRVSSYFLRPHDSRIERMVEQIYAIDHQKTETAIEALILESHLIKKHEPPFNIREKDDKSFLYVGISREPFPRVLLVRGKDREAGGIRWRKLYGPFTSASSIREALRIIRKIFPFNVHDSAAKFSRPCFDYQIGLCPGVCAGTARKAEYLKTVRNIALFFEGEKKKIVQSLRKEMKEASKGLEFEMAQRLQKQLFALEHIQDVALINEPELFSGATNDNQFRIEGYDISNISGTAAVGSMVVFVDDKPEKSEYRKFRIKTVRGANDVGMIKEVLERRLRNSWPLPQLILVDGGAPQVNIARRVIGQAGLRIPVIGLAKGPERKRNDLIGTVPSGVKVSTLIAVRDEAHRFAIGYHTRLRSRNFLPQK